LAEMRAKAFADPELRAALEVFSDDPYGKLWCNLGGLIYECAPPRDIPGVLAQIEAMDAIEVRLHLLGYYMRWLRRIIPCEVICSAAEGDVEAQKQFLLILGENSIHFQVKRLLPLDAEATKQLVLTVLRRWYEVVFREQEAQTMAILQRDAQAKRALKR